MTDSRAFDLPFHHRAFPRTLSEMQRKRPEIFVVGGSNGAGKTTIAARFLAEARRLGYLVHLVFVSLDTSDLAVDRVRLRVEKGGHHIPEESVHRRYNRSHDIFRTMFRILADTWTLCDNSGDEIQVTAFGDSLETPTVVSPGLWQEFASRGTPPRRNS